MLHRKLAWLTPFLMLFASKSWALNNFTPSDLQNMTQDLVDELLQVAALGTGFRAYMPASNLGITGFDLGIDITGISIPSQFTTAITTATGQPASQVPAILPVPSVKLHKGLPFGFDVGFTYLAFEDVIKVVGGDVQYKLPFNSLALPSIAVRAAANYGKLYFLQTHCYNVDVIVSKGLLIFEPYVGAGIQSWNGQLNYPANIQGFQADVQASATGTNPHVFAGFPVKLLILKLTAEYDHSFAGIESYGARLSLNF
jgi:hypothetical protein